MTKAFFKITFACLLMPFSILANDQNLVDFFNYHRSGRYLEAYQLVEQTKLIEHIDTLAKEYAVFLGCLGECEAELEYYDDAFNHLSKAIRLCSSYPYQNGKTLINTLFQMANLYLFLEEDSLCNAFAEQAWDLTQKNIPKQSNDYCENYIKYYSLSNEVCIDSAIIEHIETTSNLLLKSKSLMMISNDVDSTILSLQLLKDACRLFGKCDNLINYSEFALAINTLGKRYAKIGDFNRAYSCFELSCHIYEHTHGVYSYNYLASLIDMGQAKSMDGKYEYALFLLENAKECAFVRYGERSVQYAWVLQAESNVHLCINNIDAAIKSQKMANQILRTNPNEKEQLMAGLLSLCVMLDANNQHSEAQEVINQYFDVVNDSEDENYINYATGLLYLSGVVSDNDKKKSIKLLEEALNILDSFDESDCWKEKADAHEYLAILSEQEDLNCALYHITKSLNIYENRVAFHHTDYLSVLGLKAEILYKLDQYGESLDLFSKYINLRKEDITSRFIGLDKKNRKNYWDMFLFPFNQMIPIETYELRDRPEARRLLFNALLFKKGILLNAELVLNSSNTPKTKQFTNGTSSLNSLIAAFDSSIVDHKSYLDEYSNYYKSMINVDYSDVSKALKSDEVAIEFATIPFSPDSILYCALIAKSNYDIPKLIPLCKESELNEIERNVMFSDESLYKLIWFPLLSELKNSSKVYFSPDGELYNIPIEHAFISKGTYFSDRYNIHRLSSSREIMKICLPEQPINSAILFGGLNYDANSEDIKKANLHNSVSTELSRFAERSTTNNKLPVESLPYTKQEVFGIKSLFPSDINCKIYTENEGTEDLFKSHSGDSINIIHLSTHGFYWSERESLTPMLQSRLFANAKCEEDSVMTRTGLYLSGSNNIIKGINLPLNLEDGIITANEISELYFNNLYLVVLSACQTGLGDLKGDGVFGLQRGFKKAGAKSILMSLWNVDDLTTQLLMVEFYRNYLAGKSKQESLRNAQQYVREYKDENGNKLFDNPRYWAGFILLDALD